MNIYFLVEGKRTEMAVYPSFLSHLAPNLKRVIRPYEGMKNSYYIVSGFGYPNLLSHIRNCVKDLNHYKNFDYFVIALDTDDLKRSERIREVERILQKDGFPNHGKVKIIAQEKCIETWFLGSHLNHKGRKGRNAFVFYNYYNVFKKNPEHMIKPCDYRGSVGDFHCRYLVSLCEANRRFYSKRRPDDVCSPEYIDSLKLRTRKTPHLKTLRNFFDFCDEIHNATLNA